MQPLIVRSVLFPLHERLLRRGTLGYLRGLEDSQWWPVERLLALQEAKLRAILGHAHERIPFYRRALDAAGIVPSQATTLDLLKLPPLAKPMIARHLDELIDASVPGGLHRSTTGGSTGEPLAFYMSRARQAADQAARARSRRWFGVEVGEREIYLWGSPIETNHRDVLKHVRDRLCNQRLLSAFNMTPRMMSRHIAEIHRFDPVHIFGYPSSIARLVKHAQAAGEPVRNRSLRAVFVTGELLDRSDRAVIEEAFGVPVADGYGSREGGFIAHQCPHGAYHVTMESLIVELLDASGRPVEAGQTGEIVLTHLDAVGMPFIRYQTGDLARKSATPCECGRALESLEMIEGRRTDMLRTADGGYAHALSVIYVLRDEPTVAQFKVVQQADCSLDVQLVTRDGFGIAECQSIERLLKLRLGQSIAVRISQVDEIPSEPSGKHRHVLSAAS